MNMVVHEPTIKKPTNPTFFEGIFQKERLLDIIKNFICFNNEGLKKLQDSSGISPVFRSPQGNCPYGTDRAGRCENRRFLAYAGLGQITQHGILCTPVAVDDWKPDDCCDY